MVIKNTRQQDTEEKVYKIIKHAIMTKQFYPDYQLVETTIAEKLGVSRTPIRSALKKLSYEGLVKIIPRKGAFVSQPSLEEFLNIFSCRLLLEKEAARLAAKKITSSDLKYLENLIEKQTKNHQEKNFEGFINTNNSMHMLIAKTSRNKYFVKYIDDLMTKSNIYLVYYDKFYIRKTTESETLKEHNELFTALKENNPQKSSKAMYNHIQNTFENLKANISETMNPL